MVGFDRLAGDILYGVFLSTMSMYWIAEVVYSRTGVFGIFGIPDVGDLQLCTSAFVFAIVFGTAIYSLASARSNGSGPGCGDVVCRHRRLQRSSPLRRQPARR